MAYYLLLISLSLFW